ncbi:MAG: HRDC domain-containing protein [Planctomycetales bacterium]
MQGSLIVAQSDFDQLCDEIQQAGIVGFDTEFVSEFTYRPELCLLQFATPGRCAAVDPYQVKDLSRWWDLMTSGEITVIVHGGREEVRFCLFATGKAPANLVDVQIAEGLRSPSFPLAYSALIPRVTGKKIHGKETRTDWRKRPLTPRQVEYALEDVAYLLEVWERQSKDFEKRGRLEWAAAEFKRFMFDIQEERTRENWRRIPGSQKLSARELGVLRELFQWRDKEAETRDRPARKTMRDDLLLELAHRQPHNVQELTATRDLNRTDYRREAPAILAAIQRGRDLPADQLPPVEKQQYKEEEQVLGQILAIALANLCLQEDVAQQLVGTVSDLRHLVRWHIYQDRSSGLPRLMSGWRAEVCGSLLTDILDGHITLRVADPLSDHPLIFERSPRLQKPD